VIAEKKSPVELAATLDGKTVNEGDGPLTKEERANRDIVTVRSVGSGNSADYLTARIARDRPDILNRMKAGEFSSVRQAGFNQPTKQLRKGQSCR
jgi:hypothetical protein